MAIAYDATFDRLNDVVFQKQMFMAIKAYAVNTVLTEGTGVAFHQARVILATRYLELPNTLASLTGKEMIDLISHSVKKAEISGTAFTDANADTVVAAIYNDLL